MVSTCCAIKPRSIPDKVHIDPIIQTYKEFIMTLFITILLALYIAYLAVNYETVNPFTIIRYASKDLGIVVGATPGIVTVAKETSHVLYKESKLEMVKSGKDTTVTFSKSRIAGAKWSEDTFKEYRAELKIRDIKASEELAELCK